MKLADDADRTRATTETGSSFLVEASAGTGKTTTLILRILNLVLTRGVPLRRIGAMTFTEKAAGEMKTRLREKLDGFISTATDPQKRERALRARFELESAEISTIHAFCSRLLRERPVEAGVDPDFVGGDELLAADLAEEVFTDWFDREARRDRSPLAAALRAGADPGAIRDLAKALHETRLVLDEASLPTDALAEARERLESSIADFEQARAGFPSNVNESKEAFRLYEFLDGLRGLRRSLVDGKQLPCLPEGIKLTTAWPVDVRDRIKAARTGLQTLEALLSALPLVPLLSALVEEIRRSFFPEIEAAKRQRSLLDFDDLLLKARDLLRGSRAARDHFHDRFETFVVDEFQDTDPVQAEIVLRLAAHPDQDGKEWRTLAPEPGRLFLVGDPKQSIYRFRRADVETYGEARERVGPEGLLRLTTSFRSSRPLIDFVNAVGPALLPLPGEERWKVGYSELSESETTKPGPSPGVFFLIPPLPEPEATRSPSRETEGDADDEAQLKVNEQEARAVANLLRSRFSAGDRPWRRIAVLVPRHATIDLFQGVFHEAGIPFVLEGGKSFYRREEVAAVIAALTAIDDPGKPIPVVTALKSLLFGASDLELLEAAESDVRFDALETVPEGSPLSFAAGLLRRLHRGRHGRPFAETLADLIMSTRVLAAAENDAVVNPVQGVANLERLLVLARDLDRERLSFHEAVDRLRRRMEADGPEPAAYAEEHDAVHLLTLHKAKGLEFPVVVLADLGLKERKRPGERAAVVCEKAGGRFGVRLGFDGVVAGTARFTEVEDGDEKRQEAETHRLVYVGLTRAKEQLVVSWFRRRAVSKNGVVRDDLSKSYLAPLAAFENPSGPLSSLVEVVPADLSLPKAPEERRAPSPAIDLAGEMASAEERLERARKSAARPLRRAGERDVSPTFSPEDVEPSDRDEAPDRARRIGVAVHAAMETVMSREARPDADARRLAAHRAFEAFEELFEDERLEATALVDALLRHPVVARAFAAKRHFAELPLLYHDDSLPQAPIVEGKIDLLFEEDDGWQIVDWKTDRIDSEGTLQRRRELHAPQLEAYEKGLGKLLGSGARVKKGLLVFARAGSPKV